MERRQIERRSNDNYSRWLYTLVVFVTIIAAIILCSQLFNVLQICGNIVGLYFAAWMLQFFFTPIVDMLVRRNVPRVAGVTILYVALVLVTIVVVAASIPLIYNQAAELARQLSDQKTYNVIPVKARQIEQFLQVRLHVPAKDIQAFTQRYSIALQNGVVNVGSSLRGILDRYLTPASAVGGAATILNILNTLQALLINFVIVLILSFYLTLDGHKLMKRFISYFPPAAAEILENMQSIVNRKFGGYLRGQLILAVTYGVLTYVIAIGFHLPYGGFIALFAAVMMLIPFIGTIAAVVPPIVAYLAIHLADFPIDGFILLFACLFASQQIVINLLSPRVMSSAVGLHPVLVVLGLLLGTKIGGLWGAIFGVPVFGVIVESADLIYRQIMNSRYGFHPPSMEELFDQLDIDGPDAEVGPVKTSKSLPGRLAGWMHILRNRS